MADMLYQPVSYLMPNPIYTYVLDILDLIWLSFMAYQPL